MNDRQERDLIFWGSVLRPALFREPDDPRTARQILLEISEEALKFPDGTLRRVSVRTLQRKLQGYFKHKSRGLCRKSRYDEGSIRKGRDGALARAEAIKRQYPERSVRDVNSQLELEGIDAISPSTLYRHFLQRGLTRVRLGTDKTPVRVRWTRDHTHELWVGDFQEGPKVLVGQGSKVSKTWLSAFIDAHSRFLVCGFYETTSRFEVLEETLLRAWSVHGLPREIYIDNARVYRSPRLQHACLELGIHLRYRPPGDPPAGGLIERFFLTSQNSFETELCQQRQVITLEEMNESFDAWLHEHYHKQVHSEIKQTPEKQYTIGFDRPLKIVKPEEVRHFFFRRIRRKVSDEFSDISIDNRLYRVDRTLRKSWVVAVYDPIHTCDTIGIESLRGEYLGKARLHNREEGDDPGPYVKTQTDPKPSKWLQLLKEKRKGRVKTYREPKGKTSRYPHWRFDTFLEKICRICGLPGISAFTEKDIQILQSVWEALPQMNLTLLKDAWKQSGREDLATLIDTLNLILENNS
jgi:putative transposase